MKRCAGHFGERGEALACIMLAFDDHPHHTTPGKALISSSARISMQAAWTSYQPCRRQVHLHPVRHQAPPRHLPVSRP